MVLFLQMSDKKCKSVTSQQGKSTPRNGGIDPSSNEQKKPSWLFECIQESGKLGWDEIPKDVLWKKIIPRLKNFETMTWSEIKRQGNHPIGIGDICKEAQEKLP